MKRAIQFNNSILVVANIASINIQPDKVLCSGKYKHCLSILFMNNSTIQSLYDTHDEAVEALYYLLNEINSQEVSGYLEESDYD